MLHGKGAGNYDSQSQSWLTKEYEENRRKGLEDRTKLTDEEILKYEISGSQGYGRTNSETYEIKQHPFPETGKKTIDMREVDPKISN